jgi:hypothetical protein
MFDQRIAQLEKGLKTFTKLLLLLKNRFVEHQNSLTIFMVNWEKSMLNL